MAESGQGGVRYGVESDGLADFLAFLDRELSTSVKPAAREIIVDQSHGMEWGKSLHGRLVADARARYAGAHAEAVFNLTRYHWAGVLMTEVIQRLMQTYRTSEELAQLSTDDVLALFTQVNRDATGQAPVWGMLQEHIQRFWSPVGRGRG
jgi:hypothetical protein